VEAWLSRGDPGLRRLLESRAIAAHRDGDLGLIRLFFEGGRLPPATEADPSAGGAVRDDRVDWALRRASRWCSIDDLVARPVSSLLDPWRRAIQEAVLVREA